MVAARLARRHVGRAKFLYGLLVGTTALSVLTVLMAMTFRDTAVELRLEQIRSQTLNTQLAVMAKDASNPVFAAADAGPVDRQPNVRLAVDRLVSDGTVDGVSIRIVGLDLAQQERALPLPVLQASARGARSGLDVPKSFADKHGLVLDQQVRIETSRGGIDSFVSAICEDTGVLSGGDIAVLELRTLQGVVGSGKVTSIGLSLDDLSQVQQTKDAVVASLPSGLEVQARYDTSAFESQVGQVQLALSIFSFFSVVMSVFMATSIMTRLLESRRREIGVQRSLGTSVRRLTSQVLAECLLALALALLVGVLAYGPVLNVIFDLLGTPTGPVRPSISAVLAVCLGFVVIMTAVASLSLRSILAAPLVTLIKGGDVGAVRRLPVWGTVVGLLLIAVVVALYLRDIALPFTALAMPLLLVAVVLLMPAFHASCVSVARAVLRHRRLDQPLTEMARRARDVVGLLVLVSLVLCVFSVGVQITQILRDTVSNIYGNSDAMVDSWGQSMPAGVCEDPDVVRCVRQTRFSTTFRSHEIVLTGIDADYSSIASETSRTGIGEAFADLGREPDGILLTSTLAKQEGLEVGDQVDLPVVGRRRVLAIIDSFEEHGTVQFVNLASVKGLDPQHADQRAFVRYREGADVAGKVESLRDTYQSQPFGAQSLAAMRDENETSTAQIFQVIWCLFGFTFAVGLITLVNNLWVAAFRRKNEVATKLSLGLSKRAFAGERLFAGGTLGLIGGLVGTVTGIAMTCLVVRVMNYFVGSARVSFDWPALALMILASAVMCALASVVPALSLVRRPLVESIKGGE